MARNESSFLINDPVVLIPEGPKTDITELVFIVDCSGSMHGLEADTAGGINAVFDKHREMPGDTLVSVVAFDDTSRVVFDRQPLSQIPPLTAADCQVGGCTALYDAVGGAIKHIGRIQKYMPAGFKSDQVIFVITTDGMENASHEYSGAAVRKAILQKEKEGWEFLFLGANIDAEDVASDLGIPEDRAVTYCGDACGTHAMYAACAEATLGARQAHGAGMRMGGGWKHSVEKDKKSRRWGRAK